jgi:tight adherence protein B
MEPIFIAVVFGICVYAVAIMLIPKKYMGGSSAYTKGMIEKLDILKPTGDSGDEQLSVLREQTVSSSILAKIFMAMPGSYRVYPSLLKAGLGNRIDHFVMRCLVVFFVALYFLSKMGLIGAGIAAVIAFMYGRGYIKKQISKRNDAFLNYFPDALDMIVRSVRSGYPLSSAIRMVADNMQPPVSTEFKQIADEIAYGSTLIEALQRLAQRIDEPDVKFFVVVLSVQQDVGGSLSEVLYNLSSIIRKRKYLRMKIKALSSEGKATGWVLGSMPFVETLLIYLVQPDHLTPLFYTDTGHMFLFATLCVVGVGVLIVKQIVNIKV